MAAAVSRMSPMGFGMGPASILAWVEAPPGSLIPRPSTGLPFGHIVAPPDRLDARQAGERFDFPLAPAFDYGPDAAVALDQKHAGHAGNPECVARREAAPPGIEQRGKREAELPVELPGIFGVVLRDGVDRQGGAPVGGALQRGGEAARGGGGGSRIGRLTPGFSPAPPWERAEPGGVPPWGMRAKTGKVSGHRGAPLPV